MGGSALGFNADVKSKSDLKKSDLLSQVVHQDLVKFGIIPELVGRLPVLTSLDELDKTALVRILTEPKNAITKQYKALFELDGVELDFDMGALEAIADKTLEKGTGARGLRSIIEAVLQPVMYDVPSDPTITIPATVSVCREFIWQPAFWIKKAGAFSYFSFTSSVHLLIYSNCILLSCVLLFTIDSSSFCLQHFGALFLSYRIYGFMSNANLCFYYFLFSDTVFL